MTIPNKYELKQTVYLKTDGEQLARIVTGIHIRPNNCMLYSLSCGTSETNHYDFEISEEKNILLNTLVEIDNDEKC